MKPKQNEIKSKLKSNKIFDPAEGCHYQHALRTSRRFCVVFTSLSLEEAVEDGGYKQVFFV